LIKWLPAFDASTFKTMGPKEGEPYHRWISIDGCPSMIFIDGYPSMIFDDYPVLNPVL